MKSKRLARQLKKATGVEVLPVGGSMPNEQLEVLLEQIDKMYAELDDKVVVAQRSLEIGSRELEDSNQTLSDLNTALDGILNSLGQGIFLVNESGRIENICSSVCALLFGEDIRDKELAKVLSVPEDKVASFNDWFDLLMARKIDFTDLATLGPARLRTSAGKELRLDYRELKREGAKKGHVLVVATDITAEITALEEVRREQAHGIFISNLLRNKYRFGLFVQQFRQEMEDLQKTVEGGDLNAASLQQLRFTLHGLKGASGLFGFLAVHDQIHSLEDELQGMSHQEIKRPSLLSAIQEIRLSFEGILSTNASLVGDLLGSGGMERQVQMEQIKNFYAHLTQKNDVETLESFRENFMRESLFAIMREYNQDVEILAEKLGKLVRPIQLFGEDVRVCRVRMKHVLAELIHVFRNILDHGIETPEVRIARGKVEWGSISVNISHEAADLVIQVKDDGAGINEEVLSLKLKEKGISVKDRTELLMAIFRPDISTAKFQTTISGRGTGMASFLYSIEELNGRVAVESVPSKGFELSVKIPFELAKKVCL